MSKLPFCVTQTCCCVSAHLAKQQKGDTAIWITDFTNVFFEMGMVRMANKYARRIHKKSCIFHTIRPNCKLITLPLQHVRFANDVKFCKQTFEHTLKYTHSKTYTI
jgi:hypothetical protein